MNYIITFSEVKIVLVLENRLISACNEKHLEFLSKDICVSVNNTPCVTHLLHVYEWSYFFCKSSEYYTVQHYLYDIIFLI